MAARKREGWKARRALRILWDAADRHEIPMNSEPLGTSIGSLRNAVLPTTSNDSLLHARKLGEVHKTTQGNLGILEFQQSAGIVSNSPSAPVGFPEWPVGPVVGA